MLIRAQYIHTNAIYIAYAFSRTQWARFCLLDPEADQWPTSLPRHIGTLRAGSINVHRFISHNTPRLKTLHKTKKGEKKILTR